MKHASTRSICGLCWPRLGGCQTRCLPTSRWHCTTGVPAASNTALKRSTRGSRPCARGSTDNPSRCAWNSIKGPSCPRCATMISSCSFPSIRSPWPGTAKRLPRAGPKMTPPMPNSRSNSCSNTATSSRPSAPKPHHARLGATRRTPPSPGRRQSAAHQPLDQCPQKLLSPRPAMVSGQRYGDLLRLPQPLADPQSRATRTPHHPGGLLPGPPRALCRRHRTPASRPSRAPWR